MGLTFEFKGVEEVNKAIDELTLSEVKKKEALKEIGEMGVEYFKEVLDKQGEGIANWKPLAPSTVLARIQRRGHYSNAPRVTDKMLIWTGRLQDSFQYRLGQIEVRITNIASYFADNQKVRPMMGLSNQFIKNTIEIVLDKLTLK